MIYQHPVQHYSKNKDDVDKVYDVGDGVDDVADVEDCQFVVVELVAFAGLEETGHCRDDVLLDGGDEGEVHCDVED